MNRVKNVLNEIDEKITEEKHRQRMILLNGCIERATTEKVNITLRNKSALIISDAGIFEEKADAKELTLRDDLKNASNLRILVDDPSVRALLDEILAGEGNIFIN